MSVSIQAGERASKTGNFACQRCNNTVHVAQDEEIPKCPNCGNSVYVEPTST